MFLKNMYFAWKALQSHVLSSSPCSLPAFQPYCCCSPATLASFQFLHYNKLFLFFESMVSFAWKIFLLISVLGSLSALMSQFECHLFREAISNYHTSVDDPFPLHLCHYFLSFHYCFFQHVTILIPLSQVIIAKRY